MGFKKYSVLSLFCEYGCKYVFLINPESLYIKACKQKVEKLW